MPEEKKVKQEGLTIMNWVDAMTQNVNDRAKAVQDASKSGAMCNEDGSAKKWDYTIGAISE